MAHEEQQEPRKEVQYPLDSSNSYEIVDEVGNGVRSVVYKAKCFAMEDSTVVAIKAVDLDRSRWWQPKETLLSHQNILNAHCTLIVDQRLWVVMPFMSAGSLQSIISSSRFPDGLSEPCIAVILKETLSALSYLHKQQEVHKGIKASNILIDSNGSVKLTDHFGMSSSSSNNAASGTPYWMAPEILKSQISYREKADIWAFGITALELAHGRPPLSYGPKRFSKAFEDMVASCLHKDPRKRPSAETLLNHSFFENCGGSDFLVENVLQGLPSLEERFNESKIHMTSKNGDGDDE